MKRTRIWELDFLRGFAIIMMIFDHLMYDFRNLDSFFSNFHQVDLSVFNFLNDLAKLYWHSELRFFGHFFFVSVFLIVSGISYTFSSSNLKRSIKLMIVALLITLVTGIIQWTTDLRMLIVFGIIHMFGVTIFLTYLVRKIWNNEIFVLTLGMIVLLLGIVIEFWDLNYIQNVSFTDLPGLVIGTKAFGADYFGIIPYWGMIMIGTVIGNVFYRHKMSLLPKVKYSEKNIVLFAGRKSLIIFLTHQLVLLGIIFALGLIFGYRF